MVRDRMSKIAAARTALTLLFTLGQAHAQQAEPSAAAPQAAPRTLDINEFRVEGCTRLTAVELEGALYPFLGPGRVLQDVEQARAALEKAYTDRGYQSVSVA